jgi:phage-related protein
MKWDIETHYKGRKEIEQLSSKMQAKLLQILELMQEYGHSYVHEPYAKHLLGKFWEIRLKDKDGIARVIYLYRSPMKMPF